MHVGAPGRGENILLAAAWIEASDVLSNGSVEQLDVLWQVADVPAKLAAMPLVQSSAIKPDLTTRERPYADQGTSQRRLAGSTRPDDPQGLPRRQREIQAFEDDLRRAQGRRVNVGHGEMTMHARENDPGRNLGYL